jgi:hypothetical protein
MAGWWRCEDCGLEFSDDHAAVRSIPKDQPYPTVTSHARIALSRLQGVIRGDALRTEVAYRTWADDLASARDHMEAALEILEEIKTEIARQSLGLSPWDKPKLRAMLRSRL